MKSPTGVPPVARKWLQRLAAALAACAVLLAFFFPALSRYSTAYFSPADISQTHSLTRVVNGRVPENELLSDLAVQMEPWLLFNKSELAAGRLPLWNPYNGGGSPHLANGQSAVFSPYSLPFYVLSFRAALLVAAALKLVVLGLFTFLFLRRLGLSMVPAFFGAITFAFGGHNVLLLGYPHPAAAATLPAGLYFVEVAFQRFDAVGLPAPLELAGLCLSIAIGLLAGQPEPCFFAIGLIVVYSLARAFVSWRRKGGTRAVAFAIAPRLLRIVAAALIAAGISAFQTLPFLEYLHNSRLFEQRSTFQTPLLNLTWPLHFFPNLLGNPSLDYYLNPAIPPPNFETTNLGYVGALALLLAFTSLLFVRRNWVHGFFALIGLVWLFYAYDIFGASRLFGSIPGLDIAPINRSQPIWLFAVACCAAFAVQRALEAEGRRIKTALAVLLVGGSALLYFRRAAEDLLPRAYTFIEHMLGHPMLDSASNMAAALAHVNEMSVLFAWGVAVAAAMWIVPRGMIRQTLAVGLVVFGYLGTGNLLKQYNPVCENRFFYPVTPAIETLKEKLGSDRLVVLGEDTIPPDTNMVYGLSMVSSYDGLWIRRYDRLFREVFGETNNWRSTLHGTSRGLRLFGADWVLSKDKWIPIGTLFPDLPLPRKELYQVGEILPGNQIKQGFTSPGIRLEAIRVFVSSNGHPVDGIVYWTLEDAKTDVVLLNGTIEGAEYISGPDELKPLIIKFDAPINLRGRELALRFKAPSAKPGRALSLWARRDARPIENEALWRSSNLWDMKPNNLRDRDERHPDLDAWHGTQGGDPFEGSLCIDFSYALGDFEYRASLPPFELFHYRRGCGRWHAVSKAIAATSEENAFLRTLQPLFDSGTAVVLEDADAAEVAASASVPDEDSPITVALDLPASKRLTLSRKKPGWVVLSQPWYPGWNARVNGSQRPILRANYAFGAVRVDAGENTIELDYEPRSFWIGVWISLASFLAGAALILALSIVRRSRVRSMAGSDGVG